MKIDLVLRNATPADTDVVAELFEQYRAFYKRPPAPEDARAFIGERIARGDSTIILALAKAGDSETAAGFVQLYPTFSSLRMRRIWIVNDLYVAPEHREQRVGKRLMLAAKKHADETGACGLSLATAPDNVSARRLYESLGYQTDDSMLHYVLDWVPKRPTRE